MSLRKSPEFIEELQYLKKWVVIALLIGIISGIGAFIFYWAIKLSIDLFLTYIAGYRPPSPGKIIGSYSYPLRPYLLPIVTTIGGLISGFIVFKWAPEAEGHGTDAAIEAFHFKEGDVRNRVPIIKLIASAITIGSGGSAGKEGPVAQIGSGFGSLIGKLLKLSPRERRIAVAVGIGAGIGSIFKAPIGGSILSSEILYIRDYEPDVLIPSFIATFTGFLIFGYLTGWSPIFYTPIYRRSPYIFHDPISLFGSLLLGVVCGILGIIYVETFYGTRKLFHKINIPNIFKPAIGGFIVGFIGIYFPQILESGYGWIQLLLNGKISLFPIWLLLLLPFLKIVATSLSIGSGGSGGVYAPSLFIGSSIGATVWLLMKLIFPSYNAPIDPYIIIGMMAFFGGVGKVPISVTLMVTEMTGSYKLFAPSIIAITIAYIITGRRSIYRSQVLDRSLSPAHEFSKVGFLKRLYNFLLNKDSYGNVLSLKLKDVMVKPMCILRLDDDITKAVEYFERYKYRVYPVVSDDGIFEGFVEFQDILPFLSRKGLKVRFINIKRGAAFNEDMTIGDAIRKMLEYETDRVAVVDDKYKLIGMITIKEIADKIYLHGLLSSRLPRKRIKR